MQDYIIYKYWKLVSGTRVYVSRHEDTLINYVDVADIFKKMDKKKFMDNVVRTHGTIRGLLGGRQKGSSRVAHVSGLSSDRASGDGAR